MGILKRYARKYGWLFTVSIFFLVVESICDLLQPTIMARIVDTGVANQDMETVLHLGGVMLAVTAVGAVGAIVRNLLSSYVSQRFGADLRSDLFAKVQRLSLDSLSQFETASLVTRLTNDVNQVQEFVHRLMRIFVRAPILAIGAAVMAIYLSPKLSVVLAVAIPIAAFLVVLNLRMGFPYFRRVQEAIDGVNRALREYLSGVRVVKAFNRTSYEMERFEEANHELATSTVQAERMMAFFSPAIILTINLGIVAVLWFGGLSTWAGRMEVGKTIAFVNYMTQMLHSLMRIFIVFERFVRAKASAERIEGVFEQADPQLDSENGQTGSIRGEIFFNNVSFAYPGSVGEPILKEISLRCSPGETVGIIGPTGAGKTTLVSLIPKLYHPTAGTIEIDGVDLIELDTEYLRGQIGFVPQKSLLFSGSILDNIRWGDPNASLEEVRHAAQVAQIDDFVQSLPKGYDSQVGQGGVNLSGGQKQRLALTRALVKKPAILILDDSTSALDALTESKIRRGLQELTTDLTCLFISQRITSVMTADRIAVLDEGRLAGWGTHEDLLASCSVYQDIYRSQIGRREVV